MVVLDVLQSLLPGFTCISWIRTYGCGIRYRYGMFKQQIRDGYQVEVPDNWLKDGNPFEIRRDEYAKEVRFGVPFVYSIMNRPRKKISSRKIMNPYLLFHMICRS